MKTAEGYKCKMERKVEKRRAAETTEKVRELVYVGPQEKGRRTVLISMSVDAIRPCVLGPECEPTVLISMAAKSSFSCVDVATWQPRRSAPSSTSRSNITHPFGVHPPTALFHFPLTMPNVYHMSPYIRQGN